MKRPNLAVVTRALATRIAFEGRRALGVHYRREGRDHFVWGAAGGDPERRRNQFAAAPEAVGRRTGGGARIVRDRRHRRPAGSWREPAGPSRVLFPGGLEAADHAIRPYGAVCARAGWTAMAHARARAWRNEPFRGGRSFIRSGAGVRYPDIQFHFLPMAVAYDGSALAKEHGFQAHVGPMRSKSRGWVRLAPRPGRAAADPVQLYEPSRRLARNARLRPAHPRDLRAKGVRSLPRRRDFAGGGLHERRGDRRLRARPRRERLPPLLHVQDGLGQRPAGRSRPSTSCSAQPARPGTCSRSGRPWYSSTNTPTSCSRPSMRFSRLHDAVPGGRGNPAACAPPPAPASSAPSAATSPPPPNTATAFSASSSCSPKASPGCPLPPDQTTTTSNT